MGKPKKPTKTLWTTPANPSLKILPAKKVGTRITKLSKKELERQLQARLKPFEAVLDSRTLNMSTGHPRMPEVDMLDPNEGLDALPLPDDQAVSELLAQGETCERAFMGRVDGVDARNVHVTMRERGGGYSQAVLASRLFPSKVHTDLRFLLAVVALRQNKRSGKPKNPKYLCRIKVLPSPEIRLTEDEYAELKRLASKGVNR